jgi:hypothetical protein
MLRALAKRGADQAPCLEEFSFTNLPGFTDGAVRPEAGFVAICGGTGSGKSALLGLLNLALSPSSRDQDTANYARLGQASMRVKVSSPGGKLFEQIHDRTKQEAELGDDYEPGVTFVDLVRRTSEIRSYFFQNDVEVAKEGKAPFAFGEDTLSLISQACRRSYRSAIGYEVEINENDEVLPFFEVDDGWASYDSRSMASAELSVFYLAWILHRAEPLSIVLIEEPETYLPPSSHPLVFSLISHAAVTKRLAVIITTHSPYVASNSPAKSLVSIRRAGGKSVVPATAESRAKVLSRLGLTPQVSAILFVEDQLAARVLNEIIEIFELRSVCNVEVVPTSDGHGGIKKALEAIPKTVRSVSFVGVIDGDAEAETEKWAKGFDIIYLPFRQYMENELIEAAQKHPVKFAEEVGRSVTRVEDALAGTQGLEGHDRFVFLGDMLGKTEDQFSAIACQRWMKEIKNRTATKKFVRDLSGILKVSSPLDQ